MPKDSKQLFINAAVSGLPERKLLNNTEHLVVPVIAAQEGVMNDIFYPAELLSNTKQLWEDVPIRVNHAYDVYGNLVSARSLKREETQNIGRFYNISFKDNKLKGEIWVNIAKAEELGHGDLITKFESGEMMEVSTGLVGGTTKKTGIFNNKSFTTEMTAIIPDHLALLPDTKGACTIDEGCGAMRVNCDDNATPKEKFYNAFNMIKDKLGFKANILSDHDIRSQLDKLMSIEARNEAGETIFSFIVDVFPDFFIFERKDVLFKRDYSIVNDVVKLGVNTQEVVRKTSFAVVGNKDKLKGEKNMSKDELVLAIVANKSNSFAESDSKVLKEMNEDVLKKFISNEDDKKDDDKKETDDKDKADADSTKEGEAKTKDDSEVKANLDQKVDSVIANSAKDPEVQEFLTNAIKKQREQKLADIKYIIANSKFEEKQLEGMSGEMLETLKGSVKPIADYSSRGIQGNVSSKTGAKGILIQSDKKES